jgi:hypothetical protein
VVLALACGAAAPGTRADRSACASARSKTLVSTSQARVYERWSDGRAVACSYREGRHVVLDTSFGHSFAPYAVNAHYVAFLRRYYEGAATYYDMVEQSLSTGRQRFEVQNGPSPDCGGEDDCGATVVGRVLLKGDGSLAWVACYSSRRRCGPYAVLSRDRRGPRLLDRGSRISVGSLRISGRRVTWRKGGVLRHARLR